MSTPASYRSTTPLIANSGDMELFDADSTPSGYVVTWDGILRRFRVAQATPGVGTIYATTADRIAAVGTVAPGTLATCLEEDGVVWAMNAAGDTWINTNPGGVMDYTDDFLVVDWSGPTGGYYEYTITALVHGLGTKPSIDVFETAAGPKYTQVGVEWSLNSSGDVLITVPQTPDCRFAGRVIIHR